MVPKNPSIQPKIRMPADNKISISDSLRANEVWKKAVGYDPYHRKSNEDDKNKKEPDNDKVKMLLAKAKTLGNIPEYTPGSCSKCGHVGHLSYQCMNYLLPPDQLQNVDTLPSKIERRKGDRAEERHGEKRSSSKRSPDGNDKHRDRYRHRAKHKDRERHRQRSRSRSLSRDRDRERRRRSRDRERYRR